MLRERHCDTYPVVFWHIDNFHFTREAIFQLLNCLGTLGWKKRLREEDTTIRYKCGDILH